MRLADFASPGTVPSVSRAWLTARLAMPAACAACVVLGGFERAFSHGHCGGEAGHRDRGPLIRGHFGLLTIGDRVGEPITESQILLLRIETGVLGPAGRTTHLLEVARSCVARNRRTSRALSTR
jgi:hypothetical protein